MYVVTCNAYVRDKPASAPDNSGVNTLNSAAARIIKLPTLSTRRPIQLYINGIQIRIIMKY